LVSNFCIRSNFPDRSCSPLFIYLCCPCSAFLSCLKAPDYTHSVISVDSSSVFLFFIRLFIEKRTALSFSPRHISVCLQLARSVFVASGSLSFSRSAEKRFQMLENENTTPAADVDWRKTEGARRNRSGVAAWKLARCSTCFRCPAVSFAWDDDKPQSLAPSGFV